MIVSVNSPPSTYRQVQIRVTGSGSAFQPAVMADDDWPRFLSSHQWALADSEAGDALAAALEVDDLTLQWARHHQAYMKEGADVFRRQHEIYVARLDALHSRVAKSVASAYERLWWIKENYPAGFFGDTLVNYTMERLQIASQWLFQLETMQQENMDLAAAIAERRSALWHAFEVWRASPTKIAEYWRKYTVDQIVATLEALQRLLAQTTGLDLPVGVVAGGLAGAAALGLIAFMLWTVR